MSLRWTRKAPGWYEARTGEDDLDRFEITRCSESALYGGGGYVWFLTWPGEERPDGQYDTLAEAKAQAAIEIGA